MEYTWTYVVGACGSRRGGAAQPELGLEAGARVEGGWLWRAAVRARPGPPAVWAGRRGAVR